FNRSAIGIFDLRPTSQARRDQVSLLVIINLLRQLRDKVRALRTRADEIHIAAQDAPKLRNLVDANLAYDPADTSHAIVTATGPNGSVFFGIDAHRTKLHHRKSAD